MSFCRICLEDDHEKNLIAPCKCDGTSKFVHYKCIEKWRVNNANQEAREKCMECNAKYILVNKYPLETYIVDTKRIFFTKNCFFQLIFIAITMAVFIPIEIFNNYQSTNFLEHIHNSNITVFIKNNQIAYVVYYYILASSFVYINLYLLFILIFILNIKRKCRYLCNILVLYILSM